MLSTFVKPHRVEDAASIFTKDQLTEVTNWVVCSRFGHLIPGKDERCYNPPSGYIAFYLHALDMSGLGLHIHPFFCNVLRLYNISPFQLSPAGAT